MAIGIDIEGSGFRDDQQIHVLHRNGTEEGLVTDHKGAGKANTILEANLDRSDVGGELSASIRKDYLFLVDLF